MKPGDVSIGDKVIWRDGISRRPKNARGIPIGIGNCRVVEFGESPSGEPAVKLRLPPHFNQPDGRPEIVGALIADLEKA